LQGVRIFAEPANAFSATSPRVPEIDWKSYRQKMAAKDEKMVSKHGVKGQKMVSNLYL
jgi:hypothetical protein